MKNLDPNIPILTRSVVPTPTVQGSYFVFYDSDNNNFLTGKDANCDFRSFHISPVNVDSMPITGYTSKVLEDAGCALKKGQMTGDQYEALVSNLNVYYNVMFDATSGSYVSSISATPVLFATLALTNVLCNGDLTGTAISTISGGSAPYVEVWDNGLGNPTALGAGFHSLLVTDASGNTLYKTFIISEPLAITGTLTGNAETSLGAADGNAQIAVLGGVAPYFYLWDDPLAQTTPVATNLVPGSYNVAVTDSNGCVVSFGPIVIG